MALSTQLPTHGRRACWGRDRSLTRSACSDAGNLDLPVWLAAAAKPPPKAFADAGAPKGAAGDAGHPKAGVPGDPNPGVALAAKAGVADWPKPARPQTFMLQYSCITN